VKAGSDTIQDFATAIAGGNTTEATISAMVDGSGKIHFASSRLRVSAGQYVAGASPVALTGLVSAVDSNSGLVYVGKIAIDVSALLATQPSLQFAVGEAVRFSGIQPAEYGVLLADGLVRFER